jgi:hypothetical protein
MSKRLNVRKTLALAASLILVGVSTAAAAVPPSWWTRDPVCDQQQADYCVSTWQSLGYWDYDHCVGHRQCQECPPLYGYMCGVGPDYAAKPDEGTTPW